MGITVLSVVLVMAISFIVFFPELTGKSQYISLQNSSGNGYNELNIAVNLDIMDLAKFKKLELFNDAQKNFNYVVRDKNNRPITGTIEATTIAEAQQLLTESGFLVVSVQEVEIGRSNPFISY